MNETPDQQIDSVILKLAEQYASLERRAKELNEEKKEIRENVDRLGIPSLAWQIGVKTVKLFSKGEREDFNRGLRRVVSVIGERQRELFPDDMERIEKRQAAAKAAKAKLTGKEGAPNPDTNPRSNPKSGGAGKKKPNGGVSPSQAVAAGAQASDAALAEQIAKRDAAEQEAGGTYLDGSIERMKAE